MADIEARLKTHASAFEGLLSLIPANKYFEADNSSQWNKRKQSKAEHKRAKKAKLDPDSVTTAAEVRALKMKAAAEDKDAEDDVEMEDVEQEKPMAKQQQKKEKPAPKPKVQKPAQPQKATEPAAPKETKPAPKQQKKADKKKPGPVPSSDSEDDDDESTAPNDEIAANAFPGLEATPPPEEPTPAPAPAAPPIDDAEKAARRAALMSRIEALRAQRKPASNSNNPRTRQELLDARRNKEALRKERKKQMRMQQKLAEAEGQTVASSAGTTPAQSTPGTPKVEKDLAFGKISFGDGQTLDPTLKGFEKEKKRRGPTDLLGQLKHQEAKKQRLENMPEEKRAVIEEKDKWAKALKMSAGEKVRDDEKLLKKALKRQEKQKAKSSREWNDRKEGIKASQEVRQKKREQNIQARKDMKMAKKSGKKIKSMPGKKKGGRPGFEGGIKSGKNKKK